MDIKRQLQEWNKGKWEAKNRAMYEQFEENRWPWFTASLDPDIEAYVDTAELASADILDLGTCSGSQGIELARRGHRVVGTDVSETALQQAVAAAADEADLEIDFLLDDITASSLQPDRFDLVLDRGCYHSICCFQHVDYVDGVKRVMKPGGVLLLKTMSSDETRFVSYDRIGNQSFQMPFHFTREILDEYLSPHFEVEDIRDSFFYSDVVDPPAKARFAILRKPA
jgi:cyclopropane fatty-acyl-phospholipid synthase-like methyltransferase